MIFSHFTRLAFSQALVTLTLARVPAGHKKTASSEWGGNRKNAAETAKTESQAEWKTALADRSFRKTACLAVPCFIHWWLIAFTVQNYRFFFWAQGYVSQKTF
ncbi:hypothetical protein J4D99_01765 [Siccationidurans ginsengisoli]|uniref:hypothetical protein n=1 Tax=Hymenobacter TaxID=89966 RepID=UPI001AADF5AB|nr:MULTISPECIES: hypothetical protein [unclassified Hymenobacter]MBO2030102.1 hypothetical protein [Hymenobacter sp. BT559]